MALAAPRSTAPSPNPSKHLSGGGGGGGDATCGLPSSAPSNPAVPHSYGYNDVVTIPAGATHLLVRQISAVGSEDIFLALRRPAGGSVLNGGYVLVPSPTDVVLAGGVTLRYSGATAATETLTGRGPLREPLVLQVLVVDEQHPPRLKYSFFVPRAQRHRSAAWEKQKAEILEILRSRQRHK